MEKNASTSSERSFRSLSRKFPLNPSEGEGRGGLLSVGRWWRSQAFEPFLQKQLLFLWTFGSVAVGVGLGIGLRRFSLSEEVINYIAFPGELMVRSLKAIFLPVVALSLLAGIVGLRNLNDKLSSAIIRYLSFLWLFMVLAVALSTLVLHFLALGNYLRPLSSSNQTGCSLVEPLSTPKGPDGISLSDPPDASLQPLIYFGRLVIPNNLFLASVQSQYLGVVTFVTLFGLIVVTIGNVADQLMDLIEVVNEIVTQMMYRVVWFIPIGTCFLVAGTLLRACHIDKFFIAAGRFSLSVVVVLLVYGLIVAPCIFLILSNVNVFRRMRFFLPAFFTAWGTASSTASLSSSIQCGEEGGCDRDLSKAVLSLSSSLNRAGSTLYEATAVLFIAQMHGMQFSPSGLFLICLLCTFSPVASMPMGALLSSITALEVYGMEVYVADLAMILSVDWLLDRFRTIVNIWGDWCTLICIDEWNKARNGGKVGVEDMILEEGV